MPQVHAIERAGILPLAAFPVLVLAYFAFLGGTFEGVGFWQHGIGWLLLVALASLGEPFYEWPGGPRFLRWLPWALWGWVALSWGVSPCPLAGKTALLLLPIFLVLPSAVARCWAREESRRLGLLLVAFLLGIVALVGIGAQVVTGEPRAAAPLGHHNLLAGWLLLLAPLTLPVLRGPGVGGRSVGALALAAATAAMFWTHSLAGGVGLIVALCFWGARRRRWFPGLAVALLLCAALASPRLVAAFRGLDASVEARRTYAAAALAGIEERPWLGWGPASSAFSLPLHLRPRPGVNPAGEIVADPHSLPLRIAYEIGLPGLAVAVILCVGVWLLAWRADGRVRADSAGSGSAYSLVGYGLFALAGGGWGVLALPVALSVVVGEASAVHSAPLPLGERNRPGRGRLLFFVALVLILLALAPESWARRSWEEAIESSDPRRALEQAVAWDPEMPIYRARFAAFETSPSERAAILMQAAGEVPGSAVLWLRAGVAAAEAELPEARSALARACRLDPLGPFAPFHLSLLQPTDELAAQAAARAFLADPRLAASTAWQARPELLASLLGEVESWPGVDPGWREEAVQRLLRLPAASGERALLRLTEDVTVATSSSLFVFRRRPWPSVVTAVEVDLAQASALDLVAALALPTTGTEALARGCP